MIDGILWYEAQLLIRNHLDNIVFVYVLPLTTGTILPFFEIDSCMFLFQYPYVIRNIFISLCLLFCLKMFLSYALNSNGVLV